MYARGRAFSRGGGTVLALSDMELDLGCDYCTCVAWVDDCTMEITAYMTDDRLVCTSLHLAVATTTTLIFGARL